MVHEHGIRTTLAERTVSVIRQRILTLTDGYRPGDRLYPGKLAEDLDVSVTPIREALKLLAAEGLVEFSPRRCECDPLFGGRAARSRGGPGRSERPWRSASAAVGSAAERSPHSESVSMPVSARDQPNDLSGYLANDDEFHRLLVAGSRSPRLIGLYEDLRKQAVIIEIQNPRYPEAMQESLIEHRELLDQFSLGDVPNAKRP